MYVNTNYKHLKLAIDSINLFLRQSNSQQLSPVEAAIVSGSLTGLTYKKMQQQEQELKFYTIEYLSRNLAYALWKRLTIVGRNYGLLSPTSRVTKLKIWNFIEQINQLPELEATNLPSIPPTALEREILRDRYEIEEYLFERDSGERHFLARDRYLDRKPCLVIQRSHQTARTRQQFEREGEVLAQIGKHSQIPELLAYFVQDNSLYLVYEHLSGKALSELLIEPWQEEAVVLLLNNLLTVLAFIQHKNVIHRNLNPDNLIFANNNWVLIDFATVKEIKQDTSSISQTTFAQGMKGYMPAEQLMGMTTFASDIYAIGMIAIHALTGVHPRKLRIDSQTGMTIWRDRVCVSEGLGKVLDRAICYHFCDRYQSAQKMLENLK